MNAGMVEARRNEERQGVNPAPADPQLLARLRLDACDSTSLMVEQYKVPLSRAIPPNLPTRDSGMCVPPADHSPSETAQQQHVVHDSRFSRS